LENYHLFDIKKAQKHYVSELLRTKIGKNYFYAGLMSVKIK